MKHITLKTALVLLLLSAVALAQDVASFEKRITVKKLPNGLTLMICERPEAPVFSFFTLVDAGSAQDPMGATGLAGGLIGLDLVRVAHGSPDSRPPQRAGGSSSRWA